MTPHVYLTEEENREIDERRIATGQKRFRSAQEDLVRLVFTDLPRVLADLKAREIEYKEVWDQALVAGEVVGVGPADNTSLSALICGIGDVAAERLERLKGERDRQYEFNAGSIAKIAALEQEVSELREAAQREYDSSVPLLCADHAQIWYAERNHIKIPANGCIACSALKEDRELRKEVHELRQRIAEHDRLVAESRTLRWLKDNLHSMVLEAVTKAMEGEKEK